MGKGRENIVIRDFEVLVRQLREMTKNSPVLCNIKIMLLGSFDLLEEILKIVRMYSLEVENEGNISI